MNISKFKTCVEVVFLLINQNYLRNLENIINILDHVVFFTSHTMLTTFFQFLICFIIKISHIFMYLKDVQSFALDFKF
jgi:hypothetical protein